MIQEVIVTTRNPSGSPQIAPMGIRRRGDSVVIAPFRPSKTLDNLLARRSAVVNFTDDVRVFAGCLTARCDWPVTDADQVDAPRLAESLAHCELALSDVEEDEVRPRLICRPVLEVVHRPFQGFNRAQAAVLELAILTSRLDRLPREKLEDEIQYLRIAIDKTAGPREQQAWDWLMTRVSEDLRRAETAQ